MAANNTVDVSVCDLLLDVENSRFDPLQDQIEVLRQIINDQGSKLGNLAEDIVDHGLNPCDLLIISPREGVPGTFVVLEGNRRVAAIKLLSDPHLVTEIDDPALRRRFEDLGPKFHASPIVTLRCFATEQREDADHWIQLRHTGQNDGVGVVRWGAEEVARFRKRVGKSGSGILAIQVLEYLRQAGGTRPSTRALLGKVALTNLGRLVSDPDVRETLGLRVSGGVVQTELPENEVLKGLSKVVDDLANDQFSVKNIYYKADRQAYIATLSPQDKPDLEATVGKEWSLVSGQTANRQTVTPTGGTRSMRLSTSRKTLIPATLQLHIRQRRINKIYRELQKLDVDRFTNCAAVMLRVFLELSVDEYASHCAIRGYSPKSELKSKLKAVADHMESQSILDKAKLKALRVATEQPDALFSTNTLNAYVHNSLLAPKPSEVKLAWDNLQLFIEKLWQ